VFTTRGARGLAVALLLAGCAAPAAPVESPPPAASDAPTASARRSPSSAALATSSPGLSGSLAQEPTAPPTATPVTPKEAGSAFLKAYLAYGSLLFELGETYRDQAPCAWTVGVPGDVCTESQLSAAEAYWTARSTGLDGYLAQVQAIRFPEVAVAQADALLGLLSVARRAAHAAVDAQTLESFNELADAAVAGFNRTTVRAQALMDALGVALPDAP
jgi:hypothetical protein